MKEYPKLMLVSAKARAEVIKDTYPEDKFLVLISQRIIKDIKAAIVFDDLKVDNDEEGTQGEGKK